MKLTAIKPVWVLLILLAFVFTLSFNKIMGGVVRGTVSPPEAGLRAFLFSRKDTFFASVSNGAFQFSNVAAGNYILLVEAAPPYRNGIKDGIVVREGNFTDAGEITLHK